MPALSLYANPEKNKNKKRGTTKLFNKLKYKYTTKRKPQQKHKPKKTMKILFKLKN